MYESIWRQTKKKMTKSVASSLTPASVSSLSSTANMYIKVNSDSKIDIKDYTAQ